MPELDLSDFDAVFPLRFYMNLPYREDRRAECEIQFYHHDLPAERFPAINSRWMKDRLLTAKQSEARGPLYQKNGMRAIAMTLRSVLREAARRGAENVLILQDNVIFHPEFRAKLKDLRLPADWGMLYFGCRSRNAANVANNVLAPVSPRIERVAGVQDLQAIAIHSSQYRQIRQALRICSQPGIELPHPAEVLMDLQETIPTYAIKPNLAWQAPGYSNSQSRYLSLYDELGNPTA